MSRHRLEAAKELGLRFVPVIFYDITEDEALQRMADSAVLRRSLTKGQKLAIVLEMDGLIKEIQEKFKNRQGRRTDITSGPNGPKVAQSRTRKVIAEKAGVGMGSVQRLTEVQRDAPDLFEKVKAGEMSINKAYTTKKKRENGGGIAGSQESTKGKRRKYPFLYVLFRINI